MMYLKLSCLRGSPLKHIFHCSSTSDRVIRVSNTISFFSDDGRDGLQYYNEYTTYVISSTSLYFGLYLYFFLKHVSLVLNK